MSVEMSCSRCGASVSATGVSEALEWSADHDKFCPAIEREEQEQ